MLSKREILALATTRLIAQNAKAQTPNGLCMYLIPETGCRCGVGVLLNPSVPTDMIEGVGVAGIVQALSSGPPRYSDERVPRLMGALLMSDIDATDHATMRLLVDIQSTHDNHPVNEWPAKLAVVSDNLERGIYGRPE